MKTLREMLKLNDDQRQVDWAKQQLSEGCLLKHLVEDHHKDEKFNQFLRQVSEGVVDA